LNVSHETLFVLKSHYFVQVGGVDQSDRCFCLLFFLDLHTQSPILGLQYDKSFSLYYKRMFPHVENTFIFRIIRLIIKK